MYHVIIVLCSLFYVTIVLCSHVVVYQRTSIIVVLHAHLDIGYPTSLIILQQYDAQSGKLTAGEMPRSGGSLLNCVCFNSRSICNKLTRLAYC